MYAGSRFLSPTQTCSSPANISITRRYTFFLASPLDLLVQEAVRGVMRSAGKRSQSGEQSVALWTLSISPSPDDWTCSTLNPCLQRRWPPFSHGSLQILDIATGVCGNERHNATMASQANRTPKAVSSRTNNGGRCIAMQPTKVT